MVNLHRANGLMCLPDMVGLTLEALNFFLKTLGGQRFFFSLMSSEICLIQVVPIHLNTYVMGLRTFRNIFTLTVRGLTFDVII